MELIDDRLKAIFADYSPALLVLFGSFARGDTHANSDIDVAVKLAVPLLAPTGWHNKEKPPLPKAWEKRLSY